MIKQSERERETEEQPINTNKARAQLKKQRLKKRFKKQRQVMKVLPKALRSHNDKSKQKIAMKTKRA